jgi:N utilization substance protein A
MNNIELLDSFSEFKQIRNIDRTTMQVVLEDTFRSMLKKKFNTDENISIIVNADKGDLQIFINKEIVDDGEVEDPNLEISISEARKIDEDFQIGEEVSEEFKFEDFGRRGILTLKQRLATKITELERDNLYKLYKDRVGDIITAEVYQWRKKEIIALDEEGNELILPKSEQIPGDYFKRGDSVRAIISRVETNNGNPIVILSRTDDEFIEKLFELEIPDVFDGLITVKKVVRIPGDKAKVAVETYDDRIDPVGACIGSRGSRINSIVKELRNENIDVIGFTNNQQLFIQRALSPAKITQIEIDGNKAKVYLKPEQVSLAIGRSGTNIKLASKLTGYEIEVYREGEVDIDDVNLDDFTDEIDTWIIDELKSIGCDTAKSVLELSVEELVSRTELEEETVNEILKIFSSEFE